MRDREDQQALRTVVTLLCVLCRNDFLAHFKDLTIEFSQFRQCGHLAIELLNTSVQL